MDDALGINNESIKNISEQLFDYKDQIRALFERYHTIINQTNLYFNGEIGVEYRKRFNDFYEQLYLIYDSIDLYAKDLLDITKGYTTKVDRIAVNTLNSSFMNNIK